MARKSRKKNFRKIWPIIGLVVILIALGVFFLLDRHKNHNKPVATIKSSPSLATNQPSSSATSPAQSKPNPGGVIDNKGQPTGTLPPTSQWTTSDSGNITLQQPVAGGIVKSGDTLSGTAKVSSVQFILSDSSVGLIDQGNLNVVDGSFSGTLEFSAHSSSGKLEVYSPDSSTGAEENIINIDVNFSD